MALTIGELVGYIDIEDSGFRRGVDRAKDRFSRFGDFMQEHGKTIAATAGTAAAAGMGGAFAANLELEQARSKLDAQLTAAGDDSQRLGEVAGRLFGQGYADNLDVINQAVRGVETNIGDMADLSDEQLQNISARALSVSQTFEQDLGETTRAVGQLMKTGLAENATQALDQIAAGMGQLSDREAADLLETIEEYSTNFRNLGLSGQQAMSVVSQAMDEGARSTDQVADVLKSFTEEAVDETGRAAEGFEAIGLDAQKMSRMVAEGGEPARRALSLTLDRLREMRGTTRGATAATDIFGERAGEMGDALYAIDPSTLVEGLRNVEGRAAGVDEEMSTGQRTIQSWQNRLKQAGSAAASLPGPLGEAGGAVAAFGGQGIATAAQTAIAFSLMGRGSKGMAATVVTSTGRAVKGMVFMAGRALWSAARVAASWFIAMGPIGWAIAAVVGLVALIIANWDKVTSFTSKAWKRISSAVSSGVSAVLGFMRSLPGRILSALGNLGRLLYNAGRNIIGGLIDGIRSMLGSVADTASNVAETVRDFLPFSPAKRGPLSGSGSPDQAGAAIPGMLASGMRGNLRRVEGAAGELAGAAASDGDGRGSRGSRGSRGGAVTVRLDVTGADSDMKRLIRRMVRTEGRGNVQVAFGNG